jgi:peptidoglycan biosynthesis protein MviN/MurJ (putative lipid II flippase)
MPPLTRWFIKTAFLYFVLALIVGILLAVRIINGLFPVYLHLLVFGWLTQLIFGMVFWMFPKYSSEKPRGNQALGWLTYIALNAGLLLRAVAEPFNSQEPSTLWGWLLVISAVLQWLAGLMFVMNSWGRVKEK